jgi:ureidoacrylate peracid hydrolase
MNTMTRRELMSLGAATAATAIGIVGAAETARGGRLLRIDARPSALALNTATTAVVVIDMQNDFGARGGMFDRAGIDISGIMRVVAPIANVLATARKADMHVIYLKMAFLPDLSDLGTADSVNRVRHLALGVGREVTAPDGRPSRILIRDTWNSDIVSDLRPRTTDTVIYKSRFSGFYKTGLDDLLKELGTRHLIVVGCTTSICVESTVRDAMFRDYHCVLIEDCMDEPIGHDFPRSNHAASLLSVQTLLGSVSDSSALSRAVAA